MRLSLKDNEPSVMGGANASTDNRTKFKCSGHTSVHPGIKITKGSYLRKCNLIFRKLQVPNFRSE